MSFLKAEWRKLIMANYAVDPQILLPYLPNGVELDFFGGKCYVSMVGFMFKNTRLLGVKVPFHINFEEVNLRFYVKRKVEDEYKRGVVFIKEIVPKYALTFVANTLYNESYQTLPMRHSWEETEDNLAITYEWKVNKKWNTISVNSEKEPLEIPENSETEFISEHYWGYSKVNDQKTTEYEVTHPKWKFYPIKNFKIEMDFEANYGKAFHFLNEKEPDSVMLLEGSKTTIEGKVVF